MKTIYTLITGFISLVTVTAAAQVNSSNLKLESPKLVIEPGQYHGRNNTIVELKWSTDVINSKSYFEVQRSFDGNSFTTIALVLDGYTENNGTSCKMRDGLVTLRGKEKAYYRLKKIEGDGNSSYSEVISVNLKDTNAEMATNQKPQ